MICLFSMQVNPYRNPHCALLTHCNRSWLGMLMLQGMTRSYHIHILRLAASPHSATYVQHQFFDS